MPRTNRDAFYPDPSPGDDGVRWHAAGSGAPDWEWEQSCLAACLMNASGDLYLVLNAATGARPFAVPATPHGGG